MSSIFFRIRRDQSILSNLLIIISLSTVSDRFFHLFCKKLELQKNCEYWVASWMISFCNSGAPHLVPFKTSRIAQVCFEVLNEPIWSTPEQLPVFFIRLYKCLVDTLTFRGHLLSKWHGFLSFWQECAPPNMQFLDITRFCCLAWK